jgi:hypothetical protein
MSCFLMPMTRESVCASSMRCQTSDLERT